MSMKSSDNFQMIGGAPKNKRKLGYLDCFSIYLVIKISSNKIINKVFQTPTVWRGLASIFAKILN